MAGAVVGTDPWPSGVSARWEIFRIKNIVWVCVSKGDSVHHEAKSMVLSLTDVTVLSLYVAKLVSASVCLSSLFKHHWV